MTLWIVPLAGLVLIAVLYTGTLWLQGTLYSEPAPGLLWRAPVAALVITCFFVLFHFIARGSNRYDTLFSFSPVQDRQFTEIRSLREGQKTPEVYRLDPGGRDYKLYVKPAAPDSTYVKAQPEVRWAPSREGIVQEIIVEEEQSDGTKKQVTFKADLTPSGKFKKDPATGLSDARYVEEGDGRVMTAANIGYVRTFRWGVLLGNLLLNFVHLALWFVCLWLILRYQWLHALLLAIAFWLAVTLFLLPMFRG